MKPTVVNVVILVVVVGAVLYGISYVKKQKDKEALAAKAAATPPPTQPVINPPGQ